jgi:hypothetical protein
MFSSSDLGANMTRANVFAAILAAVVMLLNSDSQLYGALVDTRTDTDSVGATVDGTISANEYGAGNSYFYKGGGGGFGGPLGNGTLYFQSDASSLYVGATIAGGLGGNIIAVFLDTKSGGFSDDSTLGDLADGGRAVASKLTRDPQDNFPVRADYVLEFGNGFTNLFELKLGSLTFIGPVSAGTGGNGAAGDREASVSLATLGSSPGSNVDFFTVLISDSQFSSNEGVPNPNFGSNPGFGSPSVPITWPDFNRFVVAVPEPGAILFGAVVTVFATAVAVKRRISGTRTSGED